MKDYLYIIIPSAVVVIGLVIFFLKKRKKRIENEYQAMRKRQDSALKEAIANPFKDNSESDSSGSFQPYKVKYKDGSTDDKKDNQPLMQLVEKTKISEKKYMFRSDDKIVIGNQYGTIKVLTEADFSKAVFEIIFMVDSYCIKLLDQAERVMLVRKHKKLNLNKDIIKLKSGDVIKSKETDFYIKLVK